MYYKWYNCQDLIEKEETWWLQVEWCLPLDDAPTDDGVLDDRATDDDDAKGLNCLGGGCGVEATPMNGALPMRGLNRAPSEGVKSDTFESGAWWNAFPIGGCGGGDVITLPLYAFGTPTCIGTRNAGCGIGIMSGPPGIASAPPGITSAPPGIMPPDAIAIREAAAAAATCWRRCRCRNMDVKLGAFGLRLLSILGSVIGRSCVLYSLRTLWGKPNASRRGEWRPGSMDAIIPMSGGMPKPMPGMPPLMSGIIGGTEPPRGPCEYNVEKDPGTPYGKVDCCGPCLYPDTPSNPGTRWPGALYPGAFACSDSSGWRWSPGGATMPIWIPSAVGAIAPDAATPAKFRWCSTEAPRSFFWPITFSATLPKRLLNGEYSPGGSVTAVGTGDTVACDRQATLPLGGGVWPHVNVGNNCGSDAIFVTCTPGGCLPLPGTLDRLFPEDGATFASTSAVGFIVDELTTLVLAVAGDVYIAIVCCCWAIAFSWGNSWRDTPLLPPWPVATEPFDTPFDPLTRPRGGNVALPHAPVATCVLISAVIWLLVANTWVVWTTVDTVVTTAPPRWLSRGLLADVVLAVLGTLFAMLLCHTLVDSVSGLVDAAAFAFSRGIICSMSRSESRISAVMRLWAWRVASAEPLQHHHTRDSKQSCSTKHMTAAYSNKH